MTKDDVDLKEFAKFLEEHPDVYPMYRTLRDGDKPRTPKQMERAKRLNLAWAEKIKRDLGDG